MIRTFDAAKRVRIGRTEAVDRTDNPKTGRFVMSLSEGETVWMRHKETNEAGYFVVVKLDKPQTIQFKLHWDARRAKGEKNEDGEIIPDSVRQTVPVSASQLKDLAPPGEATPVKVRVNPLGHIWPLEPSPERKDDEVALDSAFRLLPVKRLHSAPSGRAAIARKKSKRNLPGSWKWMRSRLLAEGCGHLGPQLSAAIRALQKMKY